MTQQSSSRATLQLNDYQLLFTTADVEVHGPDAAAAARIRQGLRRLLQDQRGRRLLNQAIHPPDDDLADQAEDQLVRILRIPHSARRETDYADLQQRTFARRLGLEVPDRIPTAELSRRVSQFQKVRTYLELVWRDMTGKTSVEAGVPHDEVAKLVRWVMSRPELLHRVTESKLKLDEIAAEKYNWASSEAISSERVDAMARFYKPDRQSALYQEAAELMRRQWRRYLPGTFRSIVSRFRKS